MGCDIHAVLQHKQKDGKWKTVLYDVFPDRYYELFGFLSGIRSVEFDQPIAEHGFPDDFEVDDENQHNGFWMGEHSFGHCLVEDFCNAPIPERSVYSIEYLKESFHVTFNVNYIETLQIGLKTFLGHAYSDDEEEDCGIRAYRLVFGYDS